MKDFIEENDIIDESKESFLTYSSEVLTDRAIPAAEDGLLSAQRKILWTMEEYLKMDSNSKTKKSNAVVGSTLMTSYFHGDQACYGVLCKMSQDYLMRYPLVKGQGSLGTQENNEMRASSRYTECKPSIYTDLMMTDFNKNVVPLKETYNGEFMEPVILPSLFPNAICNGRQAIGISMSHSSVPHNLSEVCDAINAYLTNENLTLDELMEYLPGPDFPLKNTIINKKDIKTAFKTGQSQTSLKVRGEYEINKDTIIFTTIPYRTYRNKIKEQIEENIEELEKVIEDFNDESNLGENRLVFKVAKGVNPEVAVNKLFALTDLQSTVSYNMNYIVDGTPKLCSILDLIKAYIKHQTNVLLAATQYDKNKAEKRAHILEGLIIVINDIDKAINLIRSSADKDEAEKVLIKTFAIDSIQAKAVLDMKLSRLTKLDKDSILNELKEKKAIIKECEKILSDSEYQKIKLSEKVKDLKAKYGDERRTKLIDLNIKPEEKEVAAIVPEDCVVIVSESGNIRRVPVSSYKVQRRNGKGVKNQDEVVRNVIRTNTIDNLMIFSSFGKVYRLSVDDVPSGAKGVPIETLVSMEGQERFETLASVNRLPKDKQQYVWFVTKNGLIKKTSLDEYAGMRRKTGVIATSFRDGDSLAKVFISADADIMIFTKNGMSLRFDGKSVGATGRTATGIKGINLNAGDSVVDALYIAHEQEIAIFSKVGLAKRVPIKDFVVQGRGGKGAICYKDGQVVKVCPVYENDMILVVGDRSSICIAANDIPIGSKSAQGNIVIKGNNIIGIARMGG